MTAHSRDTPPPPEFAAIDLGSNSFHMAIARVVGNALQILGKVKQRVRLVDGLDANQFLTEEAMARGLSCLALFAERLQGFTPVNVTIVATHALREAKNAGVFLQRAAKILPYPIEIIPGYEEARLIYMGVEHTQPEGESKLVVDIGGGSTELIIGENFTPQLLESRRMGCVSFAQTFFPQQKISKENFFRARLAAAQKVETLTWEFRHHGWQSAVGSSGTIKAVYSVINSLNANAKTITPEYLNGLTEHVLQFKSFNTLVLPGLSEDRKAVFVPGLAILAGIFDALSISEMRYSDGALREGVLYEMMGRFRHQDIRSRTAESMASHYNIDNLQAQRVLDTTTRLYEQWRRQNSEQVSPQLEALLKWAALLHEVGLTISHSNIQRHSAYILQHSNMPGFNQDQQMLISTLVRFHRKSFRAEELPSLLLFKKREFLPLIFILRLSTLLNNQRQATTVPATLKLTTQNGHWTLTFPHNFFTKNALVKLDLEKEQNYWSNIDGWRLTIKQQKPGKPS